MALDRPLKIAAFLDQHQWGDATVEAVAADFSPRRYARLTRENKTSAILMDADADQRTPQFVAIDNILRKLGVHAPEIYAADTPNGLVLMEDLGTRNIGALLDAGEPKKELFLRATDILATIHTNFDPKDIVGIDAYYYSTDHFINQAEWFLDIYFSYVTKRDATEDERRDFRTAWQAVLHPLENMKKSLLLRDYMPDNLMDLSNGDLGVLDFELAGLGCIAYDLASLCEEIRRDDTFILLPEVISHYRKATQTSLSHADLMRACTLFSAQRHTRHLANITRMVIHKGRQEKAAFFTRTKKHLKTILKEPYLLPVREWTERYEGLL